MVSATFINYIASYGAKNMVVTGSHLSLRKVTKKRRRWELGHTRISLDNAEFALVSFTESPEILTVVSNRLRKEVPECLYEVQLKSAYVFYSAFSMRAPKPLIRDPNG